MKTLSLEVERLIVATTNARDRPAKSAYASTPPGAGPPRYPKDGNAFGPPSPEQQLTRHPTRGPHRPWKAGPRATPADLPYPSGTINPTRRPARTTSAPNRS